MLLALKGVAIAIATGIAWKLYNKYIAPMIDGDDK